MPPVRLIVGPSPSAHLYGLARGWRPDRVDFVETADELRYIFEPTRHESVILVDTGLLSARERAAVAEEIRIIRLVWPEVQISDPDVVAQIDADPGRVPVLC